jgi:outer membrane biosynthesis protein TonB
MKRKHDSADPEPEEDETPRKKQRPSSQRRKPLPEKEPERKSIFKPKKAGKTYASVLNRPSPSPRDTFGLARLSERRPS